MNEDQKTGALIFGVALTLIVVTGIAPVFRTLSIGGMMTSEVCNGKEEVQR